MNRILQSVAWGCFVPEKLTPAVFVNSAARIGFKAIDISATEASSAASRFAIAAPTPRDPPVTSATLIF